MLSIPFRIFSQIHKYGQDSVTASVEVCGLLLGPHKDLCTEFVPIKNISNNPAVHMMLDPTESFQTFRSAEKRGLVVVGLFHSHPFNLGNPSSVDVASINYEYYWLIYGGKDNMIRTWFSLSKPLNHFIPEELYTINDLEK